MRSAAVQLAIVFGLAACLFGLFGNVQANLAARSIASGFGFFNDTAGFAIGETAIAYEPSDTFARAILVGLLNTLKVSVLAIVGATLLGFALGLARLSPNPVLRGPARIYIELIRNVPLLLQLLLLYAALLMGLPAIADAWQPLTGVIVSNRGIAVPSLTSVPTLTAFNVVGGWQLSTELVTLVCGLSLYSAAYIAEIVRAGLLSVPVGQREAALSLSLTPLQTFTRITLPQALRAILPPLGGWYLNTVKNSSLAVAVAYPDLVSVIDTLINQTGQAIEGVGIIIAAFLTINLTISALLGIYNARLNRFPAATGVTRQSVHETSAESVRQLFSNAPRAMVSSALIALGAYIAWRMLDWLLFSAAFSGGVEACRRVTGACWPFIAENYRLILFGVYPVDEQWRVIVVLLLFSGLVAASFCQRFWNARLAGLWLLGLLAMFVLMGGGSFGLVPVATDKWSGLPLTVALAGTAVLAAFPVAIVLALARRSRVAIARVLAMFIIELMRGTPLVGVLFMAAVMFPLLLPPGLEIDSFARVQIALVLFTAAYMAESIRAGLQALPPGQAEAAISLGLTRLQTLRHVILPQALRTSLPSLVNTAISEVKNTTLVLLVGMFDLLQTTRLALVQLEWRPYFVEAYGFSAAVFFVICFAMSQLSRRIERQWTTPPLARPARRRLG
jgi:general L-amino acid transport system permease protein